MLGEAIRSKFALVAINVTFVITGIIIFAAGISVNSAYNEYRELLPKQAVIDSLPPFYIATGVLTFLVAAFGFYAVYNNENMLVKIVFAAAMLIMLIFKLSATIAGFSIQDNVTSLVQDRLTSTMWQYGSIYYENIPITVQWDKLQQNFECCGAHSSADWVDVLGTQETQGLPVSCCAHVYGNVQTFSCSVENSFITGCTEQLGNFVIYQMNVIAITGLITTLMQAIVVVAALCVIHIERGEKRKYWDNKSGKTDIKNAHSNVVGRW